MREKLKKDVTYENYNGTFTIGMNDYIDDSGYKMIFDEDSEFKNRDDFYAAFEKVSRVEYVEYNNLVSDEENE